VAVNTPQQEAVAVPGLRKPASFSRIKHEPAHRRGYQAHLGVLQSGLSTMTSRPYTTPDRPGIQHNRLQPPAASAFVV
jgi:hypothetical protein